MKMEKRKYSALVCGLLSYQALAQPIILDDVKEIAREKHDTDLELDVDFIEIPEYAWSVARSEPSDIYLIDGHHDIPVRHDTKLTDAIKRLHPGAYVVLMSYTGTFVRASDLGRCDQVLNINEFTPNLWIRILADGGFIPEDPAVIEERRQEAVARGLERTIANNPGLARFLEKEGYDPYDW